MKQPPELIYTGLRAVIGNPTDYSNNKANGGFERRVDLRIPTHETHQRKPVRVGPNNMLVSSENEEHLPQSQEDQPVPSSLNDNFNRMNIAGARASGRPEEEKRVLPGSIMPTRYSAANNLNQSRTRMSSIQDMYTPIRVLN